MVTGRAPSSDHIAISTAPVSEAGTMPMRWSAGTSSTSRVRSIARLSFALPILDRCERPRTASVRICRLQPGRLAHGPDEKCGITGRTPGLVAVMLSILPDRRPSLGRGVPLAEIGDLPIEVNSRRPGTKPGGWRMLSLELKELQEPRPEAEESWLFTAGKLAAEKTG